MPTLVLESIDPKVHLVKTCGKDGKGRTVFTTKCGAEVGRDEAFVSIWDSDVTCPGCAVPWV